MKTYWLNKGIASFLYGGGFIRFQQKKYAKSIKLLQKALKLDPDANKAKKKLPYVFIGKSYLSLEKYDEALQILTKAYELFCKESLNLAYDNDSDVHYQLLTTYEEALRNAGQTKKAKKIAREASKYK